jgi:hypothetical protein
MRPFFERFPCLMRVSLQMFRMLAEYSERHAATDINAHSVGNDRVVNRQYPANGQSVTGMCVGHQRALQRYRQSHGKFHLLHGGAFDVFAAVTSERERLGAQLKTCKRLFFLLRTEMFCEPPPYLVSGVTGGMLHDSGKFRQNVVFAAMLAMFADGGHGDASGYITGVADFG